MSIDTSLAQTEVITWVIVTPQSMPDVDKTVLVNIDLEPTEEAEPVWLGWWDGEVWRDTSFGAPITSKVLAWADVARGIQNHQG